MWITEGPSQRNILLRRKFLNLLNKIQQDEAASQACDFSEFESVKKDLLDDLFWGARVHREATTDLLSQLIEALKECCVFAYQHLLRQQKQPDSVLKKSVMRFVPPPDLLFQGRLESKLRPIKEKLADTYLIKYGLQSEGRPGPDSFPKAQDDQIRSGEQSWPERFFGFDEVLEDEAKFEEFLSKKCQKADGPAALAIVGMGGSGKTTLARKFCEARKHYCGIWLSLPSSEDTSVDEEKFKIALLQKMMKQLIGGYDQAEDPQISSKVDTMMRSIKEELITKKAYCIVIDNLTEDMPPELFSWFRDLGSNQVREGETFGDRLSHAFPKPSEDSIIIVTSRVEDERVRKLVTNNDNIFRLDTPLSDGQCWETIESQLKGDERAIKIVREQEKVILETCGGLPLAAVALGRALLSYANHEDGEGPSK